MLKGIPGNSTKKERYRTTTLNEAFRQYKLRDNHLNDQRRNFRFSTFKKYVDKRFKKPQKSTDLCEFCQFGKSIEKELKAEFLNYDLGHFANSSFKDTLFYLAQSPLNDPNLNNIIDQPSIRNKIADLKLVDFHRSIAERQRKAYNQIRLNTAALDGKILIELDHKSKISIGEGPHQLGTEYFVGYKKVLCLGIGVFFVDKSDPEKPFVNCINFDLISDNTSMGSIDTIIQFEHIMKMPAFQEVDENEWVVFTDCGRQFRCAEFIYFLFNTMSKRGKLVNLNFHAEAHGKGLRDQHFSVVSKALEKFKNKNQRPLRDAQEVVNALNESAFYVNEEKLANNKKTSTSIAVHFNRKEEIIVRNFRVIDDSMLSHYYNFQNRMEIINGVTTFPFYSTLYSDLTELMDVDSQLDENNIEFFYSKNEKEAMQKNFYQQPTELERREKLQRAFDSKIIITEQIFADHRERNRGIKLVRLNTNKDVF
jgi:hypothetical protein